MQSLCSSRTQPGTSTHYVTLTSMLATEIDAAIARKFASQKVFNTPDRDNFQLTFSINIGIGQFARGDKPNRKFIDRD